MWLHRAFDMIGKDSDDNNMLKTEPQGLVSFPTPTECLAPSAFVSDGALGAHASCLC